MISSLSLIPSNTYKILLYMGIFLILYALLRSIEIVSTHHVAVSRFQPQLDSLKLNSVMQNQQSELLEQKIDNMSKSLKVQNPLLSNTSTEVIDSNIAYDIILKKVPDSLSNVLEKYNMVQYEINIVYEKINIINNCIKQEEHNMFGVLLWYVFMMLIGTVIAIVGGNGLGRFRRLSEKLATIEINNLNKKYAYCQSCGKNYSSIRIQGTEKNGELNPAFCSECYNNGEFLEPNLTLSEFQKRTEEILEKQKGFKAKRLLKKRFYNLERWSNNEYF